MSKDRVWCCLAGAMATPAGLAAAPPAVGTLSAAAAPTGSLGCCFGCGPWGRLLCCGAVFTSGSSCSVPDASGYVVTGCRGACDGLIVVPLGVVVWGACAG